MQMHQSEQQYNSGSAAAVVVKTVANVVNGKKQLSTKRNYQNGIKSGTGATKLKN